MRYATVREFKTRATRFLADGEETVVTRYGKPVAVLTPVRDRSPQALLLELQGVVKEAGLSKRELLEALAEVRREIRG